MQLSNNRSRALMSLAIDKIATNALRAGVLAGSPSRGAWRIGLVVVVLSCAASCASPPTFVGYLRNDSSHIQSAPGATDTRQEAIVLRESENRLNLTLFGPRNAGALSSVSPQDFALTLRFTTDRALPAATPEVFVPVFMSRHLQLLRSTVAVSGKDIVLELSADRLGTDLVLGALAAPGGIRGIAYFPTLTMGIPLVAEAFRPEFVWGEVYSRKSPTGRPCIGLRDVGEYPFLIWTVRAPNGLSLHPKRRVAPYRYEWICSSALTGIAPSSVEVDATRLRTAPNDFLRPYITH